MADKADDYLFLKKMYKELRALEPSCGGFALNLKLAESAAYLGKEEEANRSFAKSLDLAVNNYQKASVHLAYADYLQSFDEALALSEYQRALTVNPDQAESVLRRIKAMEEKFSSPEAQRELIVNSLRAPNLEEYGGLGNSPPSLNIRLNFLSGSTALSVDSAHLLPVLASKLASDQFADYKIRLIGHADTRGDAAMNMELSKRRAEAVREILIEAKPFLSARLATEGKGESLPLYKGDSDDNHRLNRRLEIKIE